MEYPDNLKIAIQNLDSTEIGFTQRECPSFQFVAPDHTLLMTITKQGVVTADTLENSCLAGRIFVQSIKHALGQSEEDPRALSNDEILNKTEDLLVLSKILDAWNDGENISKAVSVISAIRKSDRDFIERLSKELTTLQEERCSSVVGLD